MPVIKFHSDEHTALNSGVSSRWVPQMATVEGTAQQLDTAHNH